MSAEVSKPDWTRRVFRRAPWGPAALEVGHPGVAASVAGSGVISFGRTVGEPPIGGATGELMAGVEMLLDGQRIATAVQPSLSRLRVVIKPGTIRIDPVEGAAHELVTPGLRLRGHLLPQRLTLRDDEGRLVWSPPLLGLANLHLGPLLVVRPRVGARAQPEHIALWLAAWWAFESSF